MGKLAPLQVTANRTFHQPIISTSPVTAQSGMCIISDFAVQGESQEALLIGRDENHF